MPVDTNVTRQIAQSFPYLPLAGGTMQGNIEQFGQINYIRSQNTDAIVTAFDYILNIDPTNGNRTVTFPASAGFPLGQTFIVRRNLLNIDINKNVTIQSSAGDTFNGQATYLLSKQYETIAVINAGGEWILYPQNTFIFMQDTPGLYTANQLLYVNAGATALEYRADKFTGKTDTPANYSGAGSKMVRVNAGATALEFVTDDHITSADTSYFRRFFQNEGTIVAGAWSWGAYPSQTNYSTLRSEAAGAWTNTSATLNDEYKWSNVYLGPGLYALDIVGVKASNCGILTVYFGNTSEGTWDTYNGSTIYNQTVEIQFSVSTHTLADLRFKMASKNGSSSAYRFYFSRVELYKYG